MPKGKTIYKDEYPVFLELLGEARRNAGLTQVQLGQIAELSQAYISAVERGLLRLDTLQLRIWLAACGSDLGTFGTELEKRIKSAQAQSARGNHATGKSSPTKASRKQVR